MLRDCQMLLKKTLFIAVIIGLVGCSKDTEKKQVEQVSDGKVDWSVLGVDQKHGVLEFEQDSSARVYVLGECSKLVSQGEKTPPQCEAAATAEYNVLMKEIETNTEQGSVDDLTAEDKNSLKHEILMAHTYGKHQ